MQKVDGLGGAVAAIEQGFLQKEIEEAAYAAQREIEEGQRQVVGLNVYRDEVEVPPPLLSIDPAIETEQVGRLKAFREARDGSAVRAALGRLQDDAREDRNLMPALIGAVADRATLGEIVAALKEIYGEYRPGS
jgi:methylmalonyl-CoA mutase N-terminal domain/subunit